MSKKYRKKIDLSGLKKNEVQKLEALLPRMGYNHRDYKFVHFNDSVELQVTNQDLHRDLKTIRRTNYKKGK